MVTWTRSCRRRSLARLTGPDNGLAPVRPCLRRQGLSTSGGRPALPQKYFSRRSGSSDSVLEADDREPEHVTRWRHSADHDRATDHPGAAHAMTTRVVGGGRIGVRELLAAPDVDVALALLAFIGLLVDRVVS